MKEQNKKRRFVLFGTTLFLVITLVVFAPLEMYLTNQSEFWFDLSEFVFIPLSLAALAEGILVLIGKLLHGKSFNRYVAIIFGVALAIYVQANFLNIQVGVMNGADINWQEYNVNFVINILIWIICIIMPSVLIYRKESMISGIGYISAILSLTQVVTLLVLVITSYKPTEAQYDMYVSNKDLFSVSKDENVIVFLLDMYDDQYFQKLLSQEPELAEELQGFTYFENSTGNYSTTSYSLATLFTGEYLYNESPFYSQMNELYKKSEMADVLLENGYSIGMYGYEWGAPAALLNLSDNYIEGKIQVSDYVALSKKLYQLVACKYLPNIVKKYAWLDGKEFDQLKETSNNTEEIFDPNNVSFYTDLQKNGIDTSLEKKGFKFIHLEGAHYPYYINENVEMVEEEETSELQCARGALRIVQTYMEEMKKKGVYDNSAIIIMADHGYYWDGVLTNPVLLVKPMNETGTLKLSNAPVSHHDFQPSILSLAGLNDDMRYGESYFDIPEGVERERFFYQYYLKESHTGWNYRLIEYSIGSDSNKRESYQLTDVEYGATGEVYSHKENCEYCQSGAEDPVETEQNAPIEVVHKLME